jgi:hypothetical protein
MSSALQIPEQPQEFILWCKKQYISEATLTNLDGSTMHFKFHPLAFVPLDTPSKDPVLRDAAVQELLIAAKQRDAREESAAVRHQDPYDDPDLYASADSK